ncbi:MAG TPA: GAF domain-containing protein [Thermoanaerobaculia bacterium]|nr:GAF domain-containing protein [Thermoanaerobaculia bacterium]
MTIKKDGEGQGQGQGSYVFKVREDTRRYVQDLLNENEKLRRLVASLESEKSRVLGEKLTLQEKMLTLREELDRIYHEQSDLRRQLAEVEAANQQYSHQYFSVEQQNNNLANLYVASYQLHSMLDRPEVISAIKEIVINLIGSEELAIYEMDDDGAALRLVGSFGLDPVAYATVPVGSGIIGKTAITGDIYLPGKGMDLARTPRESNLTACIPLKLGNRISGSLALFRMLPQKSGLETIDYELFDLLATHAATAMYLSKLHGEKIAMGQAAQTA